MAAARPASGVEVDGLTVRARASSHQVVTGCVVSSSPVSLPVDRRLWVRAVSTTTGALLYEARCALDGESLRAEVVAVGRHAVDFRLEFTRDPSEPVGQPETVRVERARQLGVEAATRQESAVRDADWVEVGRLWERSARLWERAGDPARSALSSVHAVRAYRYAGPAHQAALSRAETRALAAARELGTWSVSRGASPPRVSDPQVLSRLQRAAALTPHLDRWVSRALAGAGARAGRGAGTRVTTAPTAAVARVALASWAASSGRRRLAHALLVPVAIEFGDLDAPGRRELAETHALLATTPAEPDPDEPAGAASAPLGQRRVG